VGARHVRESPPQVRGVTLLETLVALLILGLIVFGLLQFTGSAVSLCDRADRQADRTTRLWNRTRNARMSRPDGAEAFTPFPNARPLYRALLSEDGSKVWEVLCAEK
jgi:Tfp pilus assembly protein PilV